MIAELISACLLAQPGKINEPCLLYCTRLDATEKDKTTIVAERRKLWPNEGKRTASIGTVNWTKDGNDWNVLCVSKRQAGNKNLSAATAVSVGSLDDAAKFAVYEATFDTIETVLDKGGFKKVPEKEE